MQKVTEPWVEDIILSICPRLGAFTPNVYISPPNYSETAPVKATKSILIDAVSGRYSGSIHDILESTPVVTASDSDITKLGNFGKTGADQVQIVSDVLKRIIESFAPPKSEFYPLDVSLARKGREHFEDGGGELIYGRYWLWNNYNWIDLIEESESVWKKGEGRFSHAEHRRNDLDDCPIEIIRYWGTSNYLPQRKLTLREVDYIKNPFFRIVGVAGGPFIAPAVAAAIHDAGLRTPTGDVQIMATPLNTLDLPDPDVKRRLRIHSSNEILASYSSFPLGGER
ncbi:hypothetical protein [Novosphingobium sp. P6W]|uniref:hypothetical protein n=1 Tax=Novosphingobium sp. P6W TaxID=1609758 RepID=UPI000AEE574B|nr:hypothetical protein [Novosphingobium sp. P6W]